MIKKLFQDKHLLLLIIIVVTGAFFRLYNLGEDNFWFDEVFSVVVAKLPNYAAIVRAAIIDAGPPPLYYVILHEWIRIFGTSETAVRMLSVICSVITIVMTYILAKTIWNKQTGIIAALLVCLSVFHVQYAQEARMYSLMSFLTLASFYSFLTFTKTRSKISTFWYVLSTGLLLYTHVYAVFIPLSQNIYFFFNYYKKMYRGAWSLKQWLHAQLLIFIIAFPWFVITFIHARAVYQNIWITRPSLTLIIEILLTFTSSFDILSLYFLLLLSIVITGFMKIHQAKDNTSRTGGPLLLLYLLLSIGVPFIISLFFTPILAIRYLLAASLAFYLLLARLLSKTHPSMLRVFLLPFIILSSMQLYLYHTHVSNRPIIKSPWHTIAADINNQALRNEVVIIDPPYDILTFSYYSPRKDLQLESFHNVTIKPDGSSHKQIVDEKNIARLFRTVEKSEYFWLIITPSATYRTIIKTAIEKEYDLVYTKQYGMEINRYKKRAFAP